MIQPYMIKIYILCVTTLQCNICHLTHGPSSSSEIIWTQGFFKNLSGGVGIYKNGPYYIEYGEMTDGCWWQKFGVVSYALVGGSGGILPQKNFLIFPPLELKCEHFLKQIFGYIEDVTWRPKDMTFYLRVVKTIFYKRAQRVSKILFPTRQDKSYIFKPTCNVLFII
jgi:hypothetical protein